MIQHNPQSTLGNCMAYGVCYDVYDTKLLSVDSLEAHKIPFGGKVVVLGDDARQILPAVEGGTTTITTKPVVEGGTRSQIINAAITNSPLWNCITLLHLTQNMRLYSKNLSHGAKIEIAGFDRWILDIGEGKNTSDSKKW
jgi:hypothetical protein